MGAIDRICEFEPDADFQGMDAAKRNHIQIQPKYRKLFRNSMAHLLITEAEPMLVRGNAFKLLDSYPFEGYVNSKTGEPCEVSPCEYLAMEKAKGWRLGVRYTYALVVADQKLKGQVDGFYFNSSFDLNAVRRRLARTVGYPLIEIWNAPRLRSRKDRINAWINPPVIDDTAQCM